MHRLLERQMRKALQERPAQTHITAEEFSAFVQAVDAAYTASDEDRRQLERSIHLASEELYQRNRQLEAELEERKRLQVQLHMAEKLRAVGELAAGVAHEINTPVQFISDSLYFLTEGFSDLTGLVEAQRQMIEAAGDPQLKANAQRLAEKVDLPFLRAEVPQALNRCHEGTGRVSRIVRALKDLAHPDAAEQSFADIGAAIDNTLIVANNEIKYVAQVQVDLCPAREVRCHIGQIQQVLLNLVVNSAHAIAERVGDSGQKGTIRIATRTEDRDFIIVVEDDGTGIPDNVRDRVFEPFFTTKEVGKGSGQGLSIAHALVVERHGGKLSFDSTPGKGTAFTVRLPIEGKDLAATAATF